MSPIRLDRLEAMILTLDCPRCTVNPDFCPLHAVRKLEVWDKVKWVVGLSTDDLAYLLLYHQVCSQMQATEAPSDMRSFNSRPNGVKLDSCPST